MAFKLVAVGDTCYEPGGRQQEVVRQIKAIRPDQVLLLGDVCQGQGGWPAYKNWFDPSYGTLFDHRSIELTGIPGNHDRIADGHSRPFRQRFLGNTNINNPTYFSQKVGKGWLIIALDDNGRYIKEQNTWLRQTLNDNRKNDKRDVVLAWHAPRFKYPPTSVNNNTRVKYWWDLIHKDPYTRIILNGHQHGFRHRTTKRKYLRDIYVVGTGGGDKPNRNNQYGVLVLTLFDNGGYRANYRVCIDRGYRRVQNPVGASKFRLRRPARRVRVVDSSGSPAPSNPVVSRPPKPKPVSPPSSKPSNPPPQKPPSTYIRPPKPPQDPTKRSSYVDDGVLYIWG